MVHIRQVTRAREKRSMTLQSRDAINIPTKGRLSAVLEELEEELRDQYKLEQEYQTIQV